MLQDPEIDRHICNLSRVETVLGYAVLAFFTLIFVIIFVSPTRR